MLEGIPAIAFKTYYKWQVYDYRTYVNKVTLHSNILEFVCFSTTSRLRGYC